MTEPSDETTDARIAARMERIGARRARHRQRPVVVRAVVATIGLVLLVLAVPLAIVLPELGVPALLGVLSLLALEFAWAARAMGRVIRTWERLKRWYRARGQAGKSLVWIVAIVAAYGLYELGRYLLH